MRILVLFLPLLATGCIVGTVAETAVDVATLPVKAVGAGIDAVTTTQAEADEDRGRALRKAEQRHDRKMRRWEKECARLTERGAACPPPPRYEPPRG